MQNLFVFLVHLQRVIQDTEAEVARVNRSMSIRRSKKKSNLLNGARIKACISRYRCDNGTYTRIQFLRADVHCVRSLALCPEDGSAESDVDDDDHPRGGGQRRQWRRPAGSRCRISGSLRSLQHSDSARHLKSACALRTDSSAFVVPADRFHHSSFNSDSAHSHPLTGII